MNNTITTTTSTTSIPAGYATMATPVTYTTGTSLVGTFNPNTITINPDLLIPDYKPEQLNMIFKPTKEVAKEIKKIIERKKDKVYEFVFYDGKHIKTICAEEDDFSLEYACFLAIAKHEFADKYTFEGIIQKSYELMYQKEYIKKVKTAISIFKKEQKAEEKKEAKEKELKEIKKRKIAKAQKRRQAKKEKESLALEKLITKAIQNAK